MSEIWENPGAVMNPDGSWGMPAGTGDWGQGAIALPEVHVVADTPQPLIIADAAVPLGGGIIGDPSGAGANTASGWQPPALPTPPDLHSSASDLAFATASVLGTVGGAAGLIKWQVVKGAVEIWAVITSSTTHLAGAITAAYGEPQNRVWADGKELLAFAITAQTAVNSAYGSAMWEFINRAPTPAPEGAPQPMGYFDEFGMFLGFGQ